MVGSLLDMLDEVVDGLKDDELLLGPVLTRMGSMYSALGKLEDSMLAYRRSLQILEREYGAADEVIQLYRNALQVLKDSKCMTLDSNVMEKIRIDLAELLHLVGRGKEGRELLEECFITEKYRGKEHSSLVSHLYAEAERVALEVLRIQEKAFGEESLPVARNFLASIQTKLGKDDFELLELLKRVLAIQEKGFGYESEEVNPEQNCIVPRQNGNER
ncbi:hypothetical protein LOK49_LG08G00294 [Camellia lanceoleosa]|uniref:Uncharacterized protein n=1 Tax=Camellia lanceoleosa TaxID=1840588 RepID=A0ACC0GX22_9ERIC|nr:hypothetical protein LOK49_LG08G00294 [Camellia lanceoleosa]